MGKKKAWYKRLWRWLDGKKRTIAEIYWLFALPAVAIWYDGKPPVEVAKVVALVGLAFTAAGLGHAAFKALRPATGDTGSVTQ